MPPTLPRAQSAAAPHAAHRAGYTLAHAGRQLRLGPIAFWVVVGTLVIMAVWTITTATYFAFRDDVLTGLIARQAEMQYAYEDRIADLRAADRPHVEPPAAQSGAIRAEARPDHAPAVGAGKPRQRPPGDARRHRHRLDPSRPAASRRARCRTGRRRSTTSHRACCRPTARRPRLGVDGALARLQASLDRVEARQAASLASMEESYDAKARRIRGVLADLGLDAGIGASDSAGDRRPAGRRRGCRPMPDRSSSTSTASASRAPRSTGSPARSASVPVRKPVMGELDISSGFGMRIDPFIRAPAMHTGIDFRGDTGDPVRATADGNVTVAGWQGGYGKMVEIDHGNGFDDALRRICPTSTSRSGSGCGPARSSARSDRPAARPDRICTTRRA